jgi:hypothetical protein
MKRNTAVVNLQKQPFNPKHRFGSTKSINKTKTNKEIDKFFASKNSVQYNVSIEYYSKDRTTVKSLSFGTVLKEIQANSNNDVDTSKVANTNVKVNSRLKDSNNKICGFCVYYNFLNTKKLKMDIEDVDSTHKVTLIKNKKSFYYGVNDITTTKINLRVSKAAEIYLLFNNIIQQHRDNELNITTIRKQPNVPFAAEIDKRANLKEAFIKAVVNMTKRYY